MKHLQRVDVYDICEDAQRRAGWRLGPWCLSPASVMHRPGELKTKAPYRWALMFKGRVLLWLHEARLGKLRLYQCR